MPARKPFTLYSRKLKTGKPVWYVKYRLPGGSWSTGHTTGETSKYRAEAACIEYLQSGGVIVKENLTFEDFSKNFFDWNSSWATDKKVRGQRLRERQCIELTRTLKNHVLPILGRLKLPDIDRATIKNFRNVLFEKKYSGGTINRALTVIKAVLEAAEESGCIKAVPRIDRAALNTKHKGILTIEEVRALFAVDWPDYRCFVASLLAASSGLRLGEILGLVVDDFKKESGFIHCRRSWDQQLRILNKTTKTGRARNIFVPQKVIEAIDRLLKENPYPLTPESFIFYADKSSAYPTEPHTITAGFFKALRQIGISEAERKERALSFHSHRHFLNSLLINSKIPRAKVQSITGHMTVDMTESVYYHPDDMKDVLEITQGLLQTSADTATTIQ